MKRPNIRCIISDDTGPQPADFIDMRIPASSVGIVEFDQS